MNCVCHDEPAYWQRDTRLKAGGWWECPVRRRTRQRDLYDSDPIHRITKNLRLNARRRRARLDARRERYRTEGI